MRWILILIAILFAACSKMDEVGSVRIIGSNTEQNYFNETTDYQTLFLKKNEMYLLNNSFISNLSLTKLALDSIEIERVVGDSDTLLLMTKTGLSIYFSKLQKRIPLKNNTFSICDQMALLDSMVVISQGKTDCQPALSSKISLLKINKKTELAPLNQYTFDPILDIKVLQRKVLILTKTGSLAVYEIKNASELSKVSEFVITKPVFMRVIPSLQKIMVKTEKGVVQLKMLPNFSLEKINEL